MDPRQRAREIAISRTKRKHYRSPVVANDPDSPDRSPLRCHRTQWALHNASMHLFHHTRTHIARKKILRNLPFCLRHFSSIASPDEVDGSLRGSGVRSVFKDEDVHFNAFSEPRRRARSLAPLDSEELRLEVGKSRRSIIVCFHQLLSIRFEQTFISSRLLRYRSTPTSLSVASERIAGFCVGNDVVRILGTFYFTAILQRSRPSPLACVKRPNRRPSESLRRLRRSLDRPRSSHSKRAVQVHHHR